MFVPFAILIFVVLTQKITIKVKPPKGVCMVVICNNRPEMLRETLISILNAHGVEDNGKDNIYISQSGENEDVSKVVKQVLGPMDPQHHFHHHNSHIEVYNRLAGHFKWTFDKIFEETDCGGVVVIEDDLELSPDFLDYFKLTIPLVHSDDTIIASSLWNDIGFTYNTRDKHKIKRTSFFPGLGWYLSREIWENVMGPVWPERDWDWHIRELIDKNKYDILIPEVPRDFHVAKSGTYMNPGLFRSYFKKINIQRDAKFKWREEDTQNLSPLSKYITYMTDTWEGAHTPNGFRDLKPTMDNVIWLEGKDIGKEIKKNSLKCNLFLRNTGFWREEFSRGMWRGTTSIWFKNVYKIHFILNTTEWVKPGVKVFTVKELCENYKTFNALYK